MSALLIGVAIAVVGLAVVEAMAARAGGRRWRPARRRALLGSLAALLVAAYVTPGFGLRYGAGLVPRLLTAALALLLAAYLWQLLPRLRPLLGTSLPARPPAVFFVLPLVVYLSWMPWATAERPPDGDEPYYLLVTHSLVEDFDADLANNYRERDSLRFLDRALEPQPGDPIGPGGEQYSRHNVLLPALLAPAYAAAGKHGALAVMCALAALLCWWTLRLARHWYAERPGPVLIAWFVLAFTSPLLLYSHQAWVEVPAALLMTIALDAVWGLDGDRRSAARRWWLLLVPLAVLPLLKMRFLLIVLPLLALAAWRLGRRRRRLALGVLAGMVALALGILWFNNVTYGNPLKYHDISKLSFYWTEPARYPRGLAGLFFDGAFGLFATAPAWLLLVAGRPRPALVWQSMLLTGPYLMALIPRSEWYGAWSPPFRYGVFALSLMTLLLAAAFERRRGAGPRLLFGLLGSSTAALTALWVMRPGWTYNFAHGRSHLIDVLSTAQGADVSRFLPSALRPNLALWIWPPVALGLVWLLARWRRPARTFWLGAALPFAGLVTLAGAAHQLPTRVIEAEDPVVVRSGGTLFPEQWVTARTRYRGGWRLGSGQRLEIPVVAGGRGCDLEIDLRRVGSKPARTFLKAAAAGSPTMVRTKLEKSNRWTTVKLPAIDWPEGVDRLTVEVRMPRGAKPDAGVIIDRLRFAWSEAPPPPRRKRQRAASPAARESSR